MWEDKDTGQRGDQEALPEMILSVEEMLSNDLMLSTNSQRGEQSV